MRNNKHVHMEIFQRATLQQIQAYFEKNGSNLLDSDINTPLIIASEYNTLEVVEFLSTMYNCDAQNSKQKSAIHYAIKHNGLDVVEYLIDKSKDTHDITKYYKFMAKNPHIVVLKYFLGRIRIFNPLRHCIPNMSKLLKYCCRYGNFAYIQYLIPMESNLPEYAYHIKCTRGDYIRACKSGSIELVDYLMETHNFGINGDSRSILRVLDNGRKNRITMARHLITKYHAHISNSDVIYAAFWPLDSLKFLLEECRVPILNKDILYGVYDLDTIKYLIEEHGVDPTVINNYSQTLLFGIIWNPKALALVKYLVEEHKIDVNHKDSQGRTVMDQLFIMSGPCEVAKFLIDKCKITCKMENVLEYACFRENLDLIKYVLDDCKFVCNMQKVMGLVIERKNIEVMKYMLTKVNSQEIPWELVYRCDCMDFIICLVENHELNIKMTTNISLNEYYHTIKGKLDKLKAAIISPNFDEMKDAVDCININYIIDGNSVLIHLLIETQTMDMSPNLVRNFMYFLSKKANQN